MLNFVCNEPAERQLLTTSGDVSNGWCTDYQLLYVALVSQSKRAERKLYSLTKVYELLQKCQNDHYLSSIHQHLIVGYFSMCSIKIDDICIQVHHYLEDIQSSPRYLQEKIIATVHNTYKLLIDTLKNQGPHNKQLYLLIIFALSTKHEPNDLNLLIKSDLMSALTHMYNSQLITGQTLSKSQVSAVASLRLMHVIATFTSIHAKRVDHVTVEKVVDKLYEQLLTIIEHTSGSEHFSEHTSNSSDRMLGDYLVFLRAIVSGYTVQKLLATNKWIVALLSIAKIKSEASNYVTQMYGLRPKLLVLQLLERILSNLKPVHVDRELIYHVVNEVFEQIAEEMWVIPYISTKINSTSVQQLPETDVQDNSNESVPVHDMGFDPEKCLNCVVEGNLTLVHGLGGRGYGLGTKAIRYGCYQWKILIVKENKGNEGTCVGVSKFPVKDYSHRTTSDMWLYRAYSGSLYHNGEKDMNFQTYTQGDYITVVLDMEAKTLSFGKNGEEPRVAFENIDATELYPCIMFYSTNPGEKVKITDMQVSYCLFLICILSLLFMI